LARSGGNEHPMITPGVWWVIPGFNQSKNGNKNRGRLLDTTSHCRTDMLKKSPQAKPTPATSI